MPTEKLPLWLLLILRSAPITMVPSLALLLARFVSLELETVAVFVTPGIAVIVTPALRVIVLIAPVANEPVLVQVTVWPEAEQFHPEPVADTKLKPDGSVSVTVIIPLVAADPTFLTVRVYVPLVFA